MRWRTLLMVAALATTSCSGGSGPEGTWRAAGANRLTISDGTWSLRTGAVVWSGRYRIEGRRLWLTTDAVRPAEGHETDCDEAPEPYDWEVEGSRLELRLARPEPCSQNRRAVLQTSDWIRA